MSSKIKSIHIEGYKKFIEFDMVFNSEMNILVGENEAGKSTVMEALRLVLNQDYRNSDHSVLESLFNVDLVNKFKANPQPDNLPRMYLEVVLEIDDSDANSQLYSGEHNISGKIQTGISFVCELDKEQWGNILNWGELKDVPYEFYSLKWKTFSGAPYSYMRKPVNLLFLDTARQDRTYSFNYYNKTVFSNTFPEGQKLQLKNKFRETLNQAFKQQFIGDENNQRLGIDAKKVILENVISILQDDVPLENHGSGMESLIKTQISLSKSAKSDVIMIEEPENHLSFPNLIKMIEMISDRNQGIQIIIATHSSMIAGRLDLNNVVWIAGNTAYRLNDFSEDDAKFFCRLPNNNLLQLLLAEKVILVEGATEYLLVPEFYKSLTGKNVSEDGCVVIPCNGVSFKRYLAITQSSNKKTVVITDNDKSEDKKRKYDCYNKKPGNKTSKIFIDDDINHWTWEVSLYYENKDVLQELIQTIRTKSTYGTEEDFIKYLTDNAHKADTAYRIIEEDLISCGRIQAPKYVREAIEWLVK